MCELLSNYSVFVCQLYEDKSLALHARDLIFFTTDLQTEKLLCNNSLLELIYFLSISLYKLFENKANEMTYICK